MALYIPSTDIPEIYLHTKSAKLKRRILLIIDGASGRECRRMLDLVTPPKFLDLPNELIELILTEVHPIQVAHIRQESRYIAAVLSILTNLQICRRLHELVDGSIELQLRTELAIDGYLLSERGNEPAQVVLRHISERRQAWDDFRPRAFWETEYVNAEKMTYEISGGTYCYSEDPSENTSFRKLKFEEMISPESEGGRWEFKIGNLDIDAQEVSYWLDADALFLIESCSDGAVWRIHFRELSTNEPHPQAARSYMEFLRSECEVWESCEMLNHEEIVVIEFSDHQGLGGARRVAAVILNWRTGRVLLPYTVTLDVAVLNKNTVIIAPMAVHGDEFMTLEVRSLEGGNTVYRCKLPVPVGQFGLRFQKHALSDRGPKFPYRQRTICKPDPRIEILGFIFYTTDIAAREWFTVVLSVDLFLRKCENLLKIRLEGDSQQVLVKEFEWEEWGPSVTRWLPLHIHGEYGSRTTFGSKMLVIFMDETEDGEPLLHNMVLDFNPWPIRRVEEWDRNEDEYTTYMETKELEWRREDLTVMSSLPYRAWISSLQCRYSNLSLEGNTIVGMLDSGCHFFSFLPGSKNGEEIPLLL